MTDQYYIENKCAVFNYFLQAWPTSVFHVTVYGGEQESLT